MTTTLAAVPLPHDTVVDINKLLGWAAGLIALACVAKIIFVGGRIAWDHRHNPGIESTPVAELLGALVGWILAAVAATGIATALLTAAVGPHTDRNPEAPSVVLEEIRGKYPQPTTEEPR